MSSRSTPRDVDLPLGSRRATGFQRLAGVSRVFVKQHVEMFEAMTGFETANRYDVVGEHGHAIFHAGEKSNWIMRNLLGKQRPFTLELRNPTDGSPWLVITRPWKFWMAELHVRDADGTLLGFVKQKCSICSREFVVSDASDTPLLKIHGAVWSPWTFNISSMDGAELGCVKKKWSGLAKEFFTSADNFGVSFPADLALHVKALILASVFLIDFMYFEQNSGSSFMKRRR